MNILATPWAQGVQVNPLKPVSVFHVRHRELADLLERVQRRRVRRRPRGEPAPPARAENPRFRLLSAPRAHIQKRHANVGYYGNTLRPLERPGLARTAAARRAAIAAA